MSSGPALRIHLPCREPGEQRLGSMSKRGERTIGRLLIIGGGSVVRQVCRRGAPAGPWQEWMLARKPRMLVSLALADKMACMGWALLTKKGDHRAPAASRRKPTSRPEASAT